MKISKVDDAALQAVQQYQKLTKCRVIPANKVGGNAAPEKSKSIRQGKQTSAFADAVNQLPDVREDKSSQ